jgi:hypothetical protein
MKRIIAGASALVFILAACSTAAPTASPGAATQPPGDGQPTAPISLRPDLPLEDMFPDDIGGQPVQVQSAQGETIAGLFSGSSVEELNAIFTPFGKSINDASAAFSFHLIQNASDPTDITGVTIAAVRVSGVPGSGLMQRFAQMIIEEQTEAGESPAAMEPATVAGKSVTRVLPADADPEDALYFYSVGEVMFMVGGTPALVEEVFTKLP